MKKRSNEATLEEVLGLEEATAVVFWDKLHDLAGLCGHCGKRTCPQRKAWSGLPATLNLDHVIAAAKAAGLDL